MCLLCDCTKEYDHGDKKQRNHIMAKKLLNVGENLKEFWSMFYSEIKPSMRDINYYDEVFQKLIDFKENHNLKDVSEVELYKLQIKIEKLTMDFNENDIYKSTPNLIMKLIGGNMITAKEYLKGKISNELYNDTIYYFGHYTLEAIIIYVLGILYNCNHELSMIRVSTLLERLDKMVRVQAELIKMKILVNSEDLNTNKVKNKCEIGKELIDFMLERDFIIIHNIKDDLSIVKKAGKHYIPSKCYVVCNFDINLLHVKLNLPMIFLPSKWELPLKKLIMLSDMSGGYLSRPTVDFYCRFSVITSHIVI